MAPALCNCSWLYPHTGPSLHLGLGYLAGAGLIAFLLYLKQHFGYKFSLLLLPAVYWICRSCRRYLGRLQKEKRHIEDMAELHRRTIEALALAIDAKDYTTQHHLQRVSVYAEAIGTELHLPEPELEALKAAAILHDIGKLAVPEHIIHKPGRLTPEEFEKVKIHPIVGAKILERVKFPYPVAPIVRSHHERWNGSGYPDGLAGDAIPLGARILSVVDCLDAMASPRQYRPALPLDEAIEHLAAKAGTEFDPRVVAILQRRYRELEQIARLQISAGELIPGPPVEAGSSPAVPASAAPNGKLSRPPSVDFLSSIARARQEGQMLFELTHDLGSSLSLDETLSVVSVRLRKLIAYDAIAVWIREGSGLVPKHVCGENFRLFSALEIPVGQGLSGCVVQNATPIVNGNPSFESAYLDDPSKLSTLRSALVVPLEGIQGTIGALSLYRKEAHAFGKDDLRILLAIASKVALSIENALKFEQAQSSATTDYLTGLPNARSLFLQLDRELARCQRMGSTLGVMVCDLDEFKSINDSFGHLAGNRALQLFAQALREDCRDYDYVARLGGDEFVILVPGLTPEGATHKAERVDEMAKAAGRQVCGDERMSASIGTAFSVEGSDAEQLLAEADRCMYMAKNPHREPHRVDKPLQSPEP